MLTILESNRWNGEREKRDAVSEQPNSQQNTIKHDKTNNKWQKHTNNSNEHFQLNATKLDGVIFEWQLQWQKSIRLKRIFQESYQLMQKAVDTNTEGALVSWRFGKSPSSLFKSGKYLSKSTRLQFMKSIYNHNEIQPQSKWEQSKQQTQLSMLSFKQFFKKTAI